MQFAPGTAISLQPKRYIGHTRRSMKVYPPILRDSPKQSHRSSKSSLGRARMPGKRLHFRDFRATTEQDIIWYENPCE
jgi:hypothetical protein